MSMKESSKRSGELLPVANKLTCELFLHNPEVNIVLSLVRPAYFQNAVSKHSPGCLILAKLRREFERAHHVIPWD